MIFNVFLEYVEKLEISPERSALERIASLYGAHLLHRHVALLYEVNTLRSFDASNSCKTNDETNMMRSISYVR